MSHISCIDGNMVEIDGKEPYAGFTEIVNHPKEISRRQILKHNLEYLITIKV